MWVIPAWPIASLSIDRLTRFPNRLAPSSDKVTVIYWLFSSAFYALMLAFVWPTADKSLTLMALTLCALLILTRRIIAWPY